MAVAQACRTRTDLVRSRGDQHDHRRQVVDRDPRSRTLDPTRRCSRRAGESTRRVSCDAVHSRIVDTDVDRTVHRHVDRRRARVVDPPCPHGNARRATASGAAGVHRSAHSGRCPALRCPHPPRSSPADARRLRAVGSRRRPIARPVGGCSQSQPTDRHPNLRQRADDEFRPVAHADSHEHRTRTARDGHAGEQRQPPCRIPNTELVHRRISQDRRAHTWRRGHGPNGRCELTCWRHPLTPSPHTVDLPSLAAT